ncbi:MAG: hypothetical protein ABIG34_03505 [Candidatus Peregrinibacteria bacterium]
MTQKLFPIFGPDDLREARLIFKDGPEKPGVSSGEKIRQDQEKLGPGLTEAAAALREAARTLNDPKINEMLADKETVKMIASQVELLPGNKSKKWLTAIALSFLQKSGEVFTGEGQAINAAKDKSTVNAKECARILQVTIDELKAQEKAYRDAGGEGDFPGFDASLNGVLQKKADFDTFKKRFDQLVDLLKDILWATDDEIQKVDPWKKKLTAAGISEDRLKPYIDATEPTARRSALLKIVRETGGIELLTADEREKVDAAIKAIDTKLAAMEIDQQKHIQDEFQERVRYLDRLGGTDQEALIHLSVERNGKFRLDALIQRLEILKKAKLTGPQKDVLEESLGLKGAIVLADLVQVKKIREKYKIKDDNEIKKLILAILKGGREAVEADRAKSETELKKTVPSATVSIDDFSRDLLSLWNTGKAEDYLRSEGVKIDNPTGISLSALALRARMPEDVVKTLEDGNYRPSPSVLVSVAKMERFGTKKKEVPLGKPQAILALSPDIDRIVAASLKVSVENLKKALEKIHTAKGGVVASGLAERDIADFLKAGLIQVFGPDNKFYLIPNEDALMTRMGTLTVETDVDEAGFLGRESATAIVESVTEPTGSGTGFKLKNDGGLLLEYLTFLHFDGNGAEADKEAKKKLAEFKAVGGPLLHQTDGTYLVNRGLLIQQLNELPVAAGSKPMDIYTKMRTAKVHEVTWKESVGNHASEFWKLAKAGGSIWWDYIAGIRKNFWDPEHDADLLKLLNQQTALEGGKAALEKLQTASSGAQKFLETTENGLRGRREAQLKAIRGDPAVSPLEHQEQARALLMANQYVIGQLNTMGWSMRSKRLRQLTLWMSMLKYKDTKGDPEKGLNEAKELLQKTAALVTPERQDAFVDTWIAEHPADRDAFLSYTDARALVENEEGRDIVGPLRQRGLLLKPRALDLLRQEPDPANPAINLAANVGRWLMDPPEQVRASLEIALENGPAKKAFLDAFVTGAEQTYEHQGRTEKVTVTDARMAVDVIQKRLLFEMRGSIRAKEQIEDEDEFTNPVDRWLRTGLESMKDLWNTDMVGKAEVIAIAFAAYWMIREAWKSKKGKFLLLGLPILLGVNHIVKQRTGRDLLGENMRWKNKEDRTSPLEAFRRRGAALDERYEMLMQPSGQAAIRVLMDEKHPVKVEELLAWREAVKSGGGKKFALGAPASLRVSDIEDNLGSTGSKEKAYKVAYFAFEALCGDVARINGLAGGNVDTNAEQGADTIRQRYVVNRAANLKPATMFEVIMSECQMPTKEMLENRNYLEAAADMFGYTYTEAAALVKKYGTQAWVMMKQGIHKVPEIYEASKDAVFNSAEAVWDWMRVTGAKLGPEVKDDFITAWKFVIDTGSKIGMTVVEVTPGVIGFVFEGTVNVAGRTFEELKGIYDYMLTVPLLHDYIEPFLESVGRVFGHQFEELNLEKANEQYKEEEQSLVSMFSGGNYPIRDVLAPTATISAFERTRIRRTNILKFTDAAGAIISEDKVRESLVKWQVEIAKKLFDVDIDTEEKFKALKPAQKRYVFEVLTTNLYSQITKNPALLTAIQTFDRNKSTLEGTLRGAETDRDRRKVDNEQEHANLSRLKSLEQEKTSLSQEQASLLVLLPPLVASLDPNDQKKAREMNQRLTVIVAKLNVITPQIVGIPAAETKATNASAALATAEQVLVTAQRDLEALLEKGIDPPVAIEFDKLLTVPGAAAAPNNIDSEILSVAGSAGRRSDLLKALTPQDSKIFFLPFNWLVGDAEYRAMKVSADQWLKRRIDRDPTYQKCLKENTEAAARSSYERYLENVVLGEVFLRGMLTSYSIPEKEQHRPLHLSVHEARLLDQYLEERERLVTFQQFLEVWNGVKDTERASKLP